VNATEWYTFIGIVILWFVIVLTAQFFPKQQEMEESVITTSQFLFGMGPGWNYHLGSCKQGV
jgi:hypothetical protein